MSVAELAETPLGFSVVVPAYNAESTVGRAVASAFACGAREVVVVDDGSSDATSVLAREAGARVIGQRNGGASLARLAGLERVTTPLTVFLDADDRLEPDGVSASVTLLTSDTRVVAVLGGARAIDADGRSRLLGPVSEELSLESLVAAGASPRPPAAITWRTAALRASLSVEPAALRTKYAEDYELLIRVASLGALSAHRAIACSYWLTGGKSSRQPEAGARDALLIAAYYAEAWKLRAPRATARRVKAQAIVRRSTSMVGYESSPKTWFALLGAWFLSPTYITAWFIRGVRARTVGSR